MKNPHSIIEAIVLCYSRAIPFAAWRLPGSSRLCFACSPLPGAKVENGDGFFASPFAQPLRSALWIGSELDVAQAKDYAIGMPPRQLQQPPMQCADTDHDEYIASVSALIKRLADGSADGTTRKAVISTVRTIDAKAPLSSLFENLLASSPDDFCSCFYHPKAGAWIGASPELLLSVDCGTRHYSTMALAGTTAADGAWDAKNQQENAIVSNYIIDTLKANGAETCHAHPAEEKAYGNIKHLKVKIEGTLKPDASQAEAIDALNPTPALCGNPKDYALREIAACESHSRHLYGGCIGIKTDRDLKAFVNIRCARYFEGKLAIFAGGGIMPDSDPEAEWQEAAAKASAFASRLLTHP